MGATEKTCCYSYLGLFMFSHIWVLFPSVWLIVWWNRFLRCWESFTHTMPKWFKSPLQLEVSCQQFSKHLFYNGGLWGKCFLDHRQAQLMWPRSVLLKEQFTRKWKWSRYLLTPLLMASQVKFCSPQKNVWSFTARLLCSKQLKWMRNSFEKTRLIWL